jgi:DNA-binding transcriptional MerR regulator
MIAADRAKRRAARAEELRMLYHQHELASVRRMTELTRAEAVLEDARQALKAQRDHGESAYDLEWQRRQCESLEVELSAEERREVLRQHRAEVKARTRGGLPQEKNDQAIKDALFEARNQLRASGLDTSRIDGLLRQYSASK